MITKTVITWKSVIYHIRFMVTCIRTLWHPEICDVSFVIKKYSLSLECGLMPIDIHIQNGNTRQYLLHATLKFGNELFIRTC